MWSDDESLTAWSPSDTSYDMEDDMSACSSVSSVDWLDLSTSTAGSQPSSAFSSPTEAPLKSYPIPSLPKAPGACRAGFEPDWHALLASPLVLGGDWAAALDAVGIPDEPEDQLDSCYIAAHRIPESPTPDQPEAASQGLGASRTAAGAARLRSLPTRPDVVVIHSRQLTAGDGPVEITRERLAEHFHESLEVAAAKIGIGKSTMKLVCRRLGVGHWPYKHQGKRGSKGGSRREVYSSD
ncbi:hypothetical protein GUITHDRAFT_99418 [Guillardia theta CCMP2712]|uniref:RWP-RK domain-containing protein n=1 Tax=Guillardia theta (strain CCMP2712) TaxID=905079 RepID=L1K1P3_GUITC|nr:hypothetical protein GUITHDRAFT_149855 [Guillardia theta CCMP2712]XP_005841743.1 hypothetical protein GUITHDRAFT_99416 [Guillardia theta CCMP2712]XP_005841745.1 hypothetical protein GUITHDRAFT_99418 [Guillardia theta CCMP2712]EKX54761.1 hypothetical protein GUITHDRAFT_149855 [Guillardia theta CCMP2712]EKX54763.1 hypothetical protein GUITHDRAFT_99416 [Guillardia theta CCMP2712]EKX54765.1 hypothetical protein GUITHDRAFT_99418 [Guillardia theta CCMP2712]|eukprot:XP_005841741.1 hypothetical protein GUITHDRAFT_149855 [Guillardia theta CCMP2712]